ncbi:glycosyl hydrolase family 61-domain-containing protein [Dichomitus squalens]|uniref:lytic cellulose monooxygenase (C4-dehydrogenating) n=1 Tax=Dichomitus squalens TaxID=114155 RepID=A0A4Q9PBF9_9APHY|nr:glycosyl hydrolase family 61-domain-containing protein [Dichomitus squalens]TBU49486.1 glycosyl hydrolase family 61-domain-containing protein [Dichomitus squalens]
MFTSLSLFAFAVALVAPSTVNAHGYVHSIEAGGKNYSGWLPFTDPYESPVPKRIVRKVPDDGPILDVTSSDIACNKGGESPAGLVATAAAGSKIVFDWLSWPADHLGPVSTYMTSCDGPCTSFDASNAKWFKIDAAGYSNGKWASAQLIDNGFQWTSTIPSGLKPGNYLIRNEIIALHDANQPQFYPSCAQLSVTGSGTQTPSGSELVSIPGVYNDVKFPDIWSDSFKSFTIPGPAPAFSGSGSGSGASGPAPSSTKSSATASSTHVTSAAASSAEVSTSARSTHVSTSVHTSATDSVTSSIATSSASASTGRCKSKARRSMVKRHVSHLAKRHH